MRGIYKIINKTTNKIYIGESLDILRRWEEHRNNLNNNKHHSYKLQQDWNTYGQDNFDFKIVSVLDESITNYIGKYICVIFEYVYINKYNTIENGYNVENTLQCVVNKTKSITNNIEKDYGICKRYCNMYKNGEIINKDGIIFINKYSFKDINKELNISNEKGKEYFTYSSFYSGITKKVLKEEKCINGIITNSNYTYTKFTYELYKNILKEIREVLKNKSNK